MDLSSRSCCDIEGCLPESPKYPTSAIYTGLYPKTKGLPAIMMGTVEVQVSLAFGVQEFLDGLPNFTC